MQIINRIPRAWVPAGGWDGPWTKIFDGAALPDSGGGYDWNKDGTEAAVIDTNRLHLTDDSAVDRINYYRTGGSIGFNNATGWTYEVSAQIIANTGTRCNVIYLADQTYNLETNFNTTGIVIIDNDTKSHAHDLSAGQHIIRVTGKATVYKVYLDAALVITGVLGDANLNDNYQFGCTDNNDQGEAFWKYVKYYIGGAEAP